MCRGDFSEASAEASARPTERPTRYSWETSDSDRFAARSSRDGQTSALIMGVITMYYYYYFIFASQHGPLAPLSRESLARYHRAISSSSTKKKVLRAKRPRRGTPQTTQHARDPHPVRNATSTTQQPTASDPAPKEPRSPLKRPARNHAREGRSAHQAPASTHGSFQGLQLLYKHNSDRTKRRRLVRHQRPQCLPFMTM